MSLVNHGPNKPVPGVDGYFVLNEPESGVLLPAKDYPQNEKRPKLFEPLTIRNVTYKNRIWVSPMCQYSAENGFTTDWHLVHLGALATRGVGSVTVEATGVVPEGRITPECTGIWSDEHIANLKRIVNYAHGQGTKIGIQLAHAGRKASTLALWAISSTGTVIAREQEGGWPQGVFGPSDIPFDTTHVVPKPMTLENIKEVEEAYAAAVRRCKTIGFDHIELHMAHGYLIHSFYSPLSNNRTDDYGGSFDNRIRLALQIARRVRKEWGEDKPLFVRVSASDWAEGPEKDEHGEWKQWGIEQTNLLAGELQKVGVDLIDVSSGGNWAKQEITVGPGYQVPFAGAVKAAHPTLLVNAVGLITDPHQAEGYLQEGKADTVMLARALLREADWVFNAAQALGVAVKAPNQYERAYTRMLKPQKL